MIETIRTAPKNSLILIMDRASGEIPKSMNSRLVAATDTCVAVGTTSEFDSETLISLSDENSLAPRDDAPVFDGVLSTPSKHLAVCSVLGEVLLSFEVPATATRIRIWANHHSEPDNIQIIADAAAAQHL